MTHPVPVQRHSIDQFFTICFILLGLAFLVASVSVNHELFGALLDAFVDAFVIAFGSSILILIIYPIALLVARVTKKSNNTSHKNLRSLVVKSVILVCLIGANDSAWVRAQASSALGGQLHFGVLTYTQNGIVQTTDCYKLFVMIVLICSIINGLWNLVWFGISKVRRTLPDQAYATLHLRLLLADISLWVGAQSGLTGSMSLFIVAIAAGVAIKSSAKSLRNNAEQAARLEEANKCIELAQSKFGRLISDEEKLSLQNVSKLSTLETYSKHLRQLQFAPEVIEQEIMEFLSMDTVGGTKR